MPNQYISGDALLYCLKEVKFKPPKGTYVYDVLLSQATESTLWNSFWRNKRRTREGKIHTIILPINVHNIHWYLASVRIHKNEVKLNIHNDIKMRNKIAEGKLLNIAKKYLEICKTQRDQKDNEIFGEHQPTMETQPKDADHDAFLQFYYATEHHDNNINQINLKKDYAKGHLSKKNSSEYRKVSQTKEMHIHRTRQFKNKSHCVMSASSKYNDIASKDDREEQVNYSFWEEKDNAQNYMSISERNSSEYKQESHKRQMHLYRTRQSQNKSHCVKTAASVYDDISSKEDIEEEVYYSEGEPFEGYLYPNNTWNSDDSIHEED